MKAIIPVLALGLTFFYSCSATRQASEADSGNVAASRASDASSPAGAPQLTSKPVELHKGSTDVFLPIADTTGKITRLRATPTE
jgi:hypothetical protein